MNRSRVVCFIDGFNLYHAIHEAGLPHLKWVDLRALTLKFIDPAIQDLRAVYYFSAYAKWLPMPYVRHQAYVTALELRGTTPIMGEFKQKFRDCKRCNAQWTGHEEKETDVNIAIHLLRGAVRNEYDEAFVITRDSDIGPALRMLRADHPTKKIKVIAPPFRKHSKELAKEGHVLASIQQIHIERCLMPKEIKRLGTVVVTRPTQYNPPPGIIPLP